MSHDERPHTGTMQFAGDGPGVFLRGNDAFACGVGLARLLIGDPSLPPEQLGPLKVLRDALLAVDAEDEPEDLQAMVAYVAARAS